jgi:hypothetical protein
MTEPNNGNYVLRIVRGESSTEGSLADELKALATRIETESSTPLAFTARPDGLEVSGQRRTAVLEVIANPRINQEGCVYLDLDPAGSHYPAG